jgi:hypothetical protein
MNSWDPMRKIQDADRNSGRAFCMQDYSVGRTTLVSSYLRLPDIKISLADSTYRRVFGAAFAVSQLSCPALPANWIITCQAASHPPSRCEET